jgi:hypothetical protein
LKGNQLDNKPPLVKDLRAATLALQRMLEAEFPAQGIMMVHKPL